MTTNASSPSAAQPGAANKWWVLAVVMLGSFMTTLDGSIVNIGLPSIARTFKVPLGGSIEWVIIGYLMVIAASLLTFGRLSDLIGRKSIFIAGLLMFTVCSGLCSVAPSLGLLILARALQGLGAAAVLSPSIALISDAFTPEERGRALGYNGVVLSLGVSAGPTLGGLLIQDLSWRWIFLINLPLGVLSAVMAWRVLATSGKGQRLQFDIPGAALLAVGLAALTAALSFGQEWGWTSGLLTGMTALGVVALVLLAVVERRSPSPVLDLKLLGSWAFLAPLLSLVLNVLGLLAVGFLMPFYFEQLRGYSTITAGLLLTAQSLTVAVFSPLGGNLTGRVPTRLLTGGGMFLTALGLALVSRVGVSTSNLDVIWRLALVGAGIGLFASPNTRALTAAAGPQDQGEASGLLSTGRSVGQGLSIALAGAIFTGLGGAAAGTRLLAHKGQAGQAALQQQFLHALSTALVVAAVLSALGMVITLTAKEAPKPQEG